MPEQDKFDRVREMISGTAGYQRKFSTIISETTSWLPTSTWTVETMRNSEKFIILLQCISAQGGERYVIPDRVARTIYRHYDEIIRASKKIRAKAGAETRKRKKEGGDEGNKKAPGTPH